MCEVDTVTYRDVPGFPGYRVGDDGSVWSRRKRGSYAVGLSDELHRLQTMPGKKGHLRVFLYSGDGGRGVRVLVHRLVLQAFVGPCPDGMMACHFPDANPANNRLDNLRWDTAEGNWQDRIAHGNHCRGQKNARAKLTESDVRFIRANADTFTRSELAARFGVTRQLITIVLKRKAWAWLK